MTLKEHLYKIRLKDNEEPEHKLLLVDDNLFDLQLLKESLEGDFQINFARSVDEAIALVESGFMPEIVLLDIIMPGKSGYEFCEYLKASQHTSNIPVIFVSGLSSIKDKTKGFNFGAVDYITKPYDPLELQVRLLTQLQLISKMKYLEDLAHIDSLTQVANRRKYEMVLDDEWRRCARHGENIAMLVFDIDYFKAYNDCYGHVAGDKCLCSVATILATLTDRSFDTFARIGGEEFVLILPECNIQGARQKAEDAMSLIAGLKINCDYKGPDQYLTVSIGIAITKPNNKSLPISLFKAADSALYTAKKNGRNQYSVHLSPLS